MSVDLGTPLSVFAEAAEDPHPYLPGLEAYRKEHKIGEKNKYEKKSKRRQRKEAQGSEPVALR